MSCHGFIALFQLGQAVTESLVQFGKLQNRAADPDQRDHAAHEGHRGNAVGHGLDAFGVFNDEGLSGKETGEVHVFESAIDLLSFASWCVLTGKDWKSKSLLSLGGVAASSSGGDRKRVPAALKNHFERTPGTCRIILHLDNDEQACGGAERVQ